MPLEIASEKCPQWVSVLALALHASWDTSMGPENGVERLGPSRISWFTSTFCTSILTCEVKLKLELKKSMVQPGVWGGTAMTRDCMHTGLSLRRWPPRVHFWMVLNAPVQRTGKGATCLVRCGRGRFCRSGFGLV